MNCQVQDIGNTMISGHRLQFFTGFLVKLGAGLRAERSFGALSSSCGDSGMASRELSFSDKSQASSYKLKAQKKNRRGDTSPKRRGVTSAQAASCKLKRSRGGDTPSKRRGVKEVAEVIPLRGVGEIGKRRGDTPPRRRGVTSASTPGPPAETGSIHNGLMFRPLGEECFDSKPGAGYRDSVTGL